mgnify:CR=1 FL=1
MECVMPDFHAGGLSLNFFESCEFEQEQRDNPIENAGIIARNMLRFLMMKYEGQVNQMLSLQFVQAVFVQRDPKLLAGMRDAFQTGFDHIGSQLKDQKLSAAHNNQANLFVSNCLCFLPFADLKPGYKCTIPQCIDETWQCVRYSVVPIELTPTRGLETLFIHDNDRVFAYGLEPIGCPEAEPHLIFMGTTYPAGQGFETQIKTDLEGFETVGNRLYRTGHKKLISWLDKQNKKAHVCGTSLGGSLALLLAIHQGARLSRVDALNPAGLYEPWCQNELDCWNNLDNQDKPDVFIQKQGNDVVSSFGVWKKDWTIIKVIPAKAAFISMFDHARNYAGYADTTFERIDAQQDNEVRRMHNVLFYSLLRGVVYYLGILPYHYLIRPVLLYAYEQKLALAVLALFFACMIPFMSLYPALTIIIMPVVFHVMFKLVASADIWMGLSDRPPAMIHRAVSEEEEEENILELVNN